MTWSEEMQKPTISVALCTYNGTRFLQQQLDTIAAQTRQPLELVISDDRSTDGTIEMLEAFARTSSFPVRIHQNAQQLGSTRNFDQTIRLCRGEYIALSDQDDRWVPEKLARLGKLLDEDAGAGMAFSDASLIDDTSQPTGGLLWQSFRFPEQVRERFAHDPGAVLLERPVVTGATMLFRRSLLRHFKSIPTSWVHDGWITWMSVLWSKPLFTAQLLTEYRVHASQQLGVGEVSVMGRVAEMRHKQRATYANMASELEVLLAYVQQSPQLETREQWTAEIGRAASFFRMRAEAPTHPIPRLLFLVRHFAQYRNMSAPAWRMLSRDLLMGGAKQR
ncbi:glycosyltransferase [Acidipila sp. EB88]|uniref:glycosyltransferase n=1 Tax=Acidipila sp. EB88 TaxID=2305226 RepID=UPI000F5DD9A2|nr:glycosyltransferase [Acidipila sp. EB88]RRA47457.1 glycosyltransferase [Acidipila sp. EB88]